MKTIEEIAMLHWRDGSGQDDLAALVEIALSGVAKPGITTSELMQKLGAKTKHYKGLADQLGSLRRDNPALVTKSEKPGAYGKHSYRWHEPEAAPALTPEQRRAQLKLDNPELYAELYGNK